MKSLLNFALETVATLAMIIAAPIWIPLIFILILIFVLIGKDQNQTFGDWVQHGNRKNVVAFKRQKKGQTEP